MAARLSDIDVTHPNGEVLVREVLTLVFYFRRPNLLIAGDVADAIQSFVNLVSFSELPGYFDMEGDEQELTQGSLERLLDERLLGGSRAANATVELSGSGTYAAEYHLLYGGTSMELDELPDEASFLWCWVPVSFYRERAADVNAFISTLASRLPFSFAYASLGLVGDQRGRQALARRHPGLDVATPSCVRADLGDRAAGSYWLTLLGPELCEKLGGADALRAALPATGAVDPLPGGKCRILLGPYPERGDTNRRDLLPSYQALAKIFDDHGVLHVPERVVYFVDKQGLADREAMQAWHRRFFSPY